MQFNSYIFILLFLPLVVSAYYVFNRFSITWGKFVIILSSVIFYIYSDITILFIMTISIIINYIFARSFRYRIKNKILIILPVIVNVGLLLYFKYFNFFVSNLNNIFDLEFSTRNIILPVGISFYTFQQVAYIVSVYRGEIKKLSFVDYLAFILYFPKILMGPLMEPVDFICQFNDINRKRINWENLASGIKIFSFGLFKKVMIADIFAKAVSWGFSDIDAVGSLEMIIVMLSYTFEIYFDFSGYSDMATGASLMLNIVLPINFDSPYKALSIRDFWKRWHMSLTGFFTKYIYIPLGGSRKGRLFTYLNTMIVFLISGFWHGANWTFILWGALHGIFMIIDRILDQYEKKTFEPFRWGIAFGIINALWLLFRADSIGQWKSLLGIITSMNNTAISDGLLNCFVLPEMESLNNIFHLNYITTHIRGIWMWIYIIGAFAICMVPENNYKTKHKLTPVVLFISALAFVWGIISLSSESVFVYFNF